MTDNTCSKCHRSDCDLLATSIYGLHNYAAAVQACIEAQRKGKK